MTGQISLGTRPGTIDRGRRFLSRKKGAMTFFEQNQGDRDIEVHVFRDRSKFYRVRMPGFGKICLKKNLRPLIFFQKIEMYHTPMNTLESLDRAKNGFF